MSASHLAGYSTLGRNLNLLDFRPYASRWAALVVCAGFGYYFVKTSNYAKRKNVLMAGGNPGKWRHALQCRRRKSETYKCAEWEWRPCMAFELLGCGLLAKKGMSLADSETEKHSSHSF